MLEDFQNITPFNTDPIAIVSNLAVALICGILIAAVYRITYKGPSYSTQFVNSLILLALITAVVIMVIGNNLATAFGLVGAMSIIRFRTAVRDVQDIVFIFFALAIGLAAGVGLRELAIIGTVFIGIVVFLVIATDVNAPKKRNYMLQITHTEDSEGSIEKILSTYCKQFRLTNYKANDVTTSSQAFYHVSLKRKNDHKELVSSLRNLEITQSINLFFDDIEPRI